MDFDTLNLKEFNNQSTLTGQQNIDADIILPDYYDTIGRILRCELCPVTEATNTSSDKVSIAGIAKLTLIYCGEDKKIYCYENEYKYTKIFQSQQADNCILCGISQNVFSLNYRAIGPKRIELRGVIQLSAKLKCYCDKTLISSAQDSSLITKNELINYINPVNSASKVFSVSNSFSMSDFSEAFDVIIKSDSKIKITEIKTIHNKAYIKGTAETELIYYSNSSGNVNSTVLSLPVSEIIDLFGAEEDDICKVYINETSTQLTLKESGTETTSLECRIDINIDAEVYRSLTGSVVSDVYSIKNELLKTKDFCEIISDCSKLTKTDSITFEADIYDDGAYTVCRAWADNIKISYEKSGNRFMLLVSLKFNLLMKDSDGSLNIISRDYTYESTLVSENTNNELRSIYANVLSVSALQVSDGKIRFTSEILIEAELMNICKVYGFTLIEADNTVKSDSACKFVIYFAKKNEEIWSVAKENRTSVEAIKKINNLSGDTVTEDTMLLLPAF